MIKVKVQIKDSNTLVLLEDARKGSIIDLRDLSVNHDIILEAIKKAKDEEYEKRFKDFKKNAEFEKENDLLKLKNEYETAISKIRKDLAEKQNELKLLETQAIIEKERAIEKIKKEEQQVLLKREESLKQIIEDLKSQIKVFEQIQEQIIENEKQKIELNYQEKIKGYELHIEKIKSEAVIEKQKQLDLTRENRNSLENNYKDQLQKKESEIQVLKGRISNIEENLNLKNSSKINEIKNELEKQINAKEKDISNLRIEFAKKESDYKEEISEKEKQIDDIKRSKGQMNVKQIGEDLENWCNEQWKGVSTYGFKTSTFEKDNISIRLEGENKGTKGDYIFKVYSNNSEEKILVTSAMCEMKSEQLVGENKKSNYDHFHKLDIDRKKKNLEYAILISELEYNYESDAPIFMVKDYEKMYVVRPKYFISLLGIIESIGLKHAELITQKEIEKIEFKDSQAIIDEFETFKNSILDNSFKHINTQIESISSNATTISKEASKILDSIQKITNTHLNTIRNKIENLSIQSLNRKIRKTE